MLKDLRAHVGKPVAIFMVSDPKNPWWGIIESVTAGRLHLRRFCDKGEDLGALYIPVSNILCFTSGYRLLAEAALNFCNQLEVER